MQGSILANMFHHDYLSKRMCKGLSSYKYHSSGLTWLDHLHDPFWNYCVNWMPTWLAPNLITLTGTMFIVAAHLIFIAYAPQLDGENAPAWVHAFAGFAILIYVNLDCMDGKQARRTGSSSPLGQLFDHGCDAFVTGIMIINVAASVGLRLSAPMILMMFAPLMLWMMSQWEEYHTGQMMYGNGVYGVLEANYAFAITHFVSAVLGTSWWQQPMRKVVPGLPAWLGNLPGVMVFFYVAMVFIGYQMAVQAYDVFRGKHTMDVRERGYKELGTGNALKHLLYMSLFFALAYLYLNQRLEDPGVFEGRWLLETVSLAYSQLATQIIIAHMAKDAYVPAWTPYAALALGLINTQLGRLDLPSFEQGLVAKALLAAVLAGYLHFVVCVCVQVACHLDINIVTIKSKT